MRELPGRVGVEVQCEKKEKTPINSEKYSNRSGKGRVTLKMKVQEGDAYANEGERKKVTLNRLGVKITLPTGPARELFVQQT